MWIWSNGKGGKNWEEELPSGQAEYVTAVCISTSAPARTCAGKEQGSCLSGSMPQPHHLELYLAQSRNLINICFMLNKWMGAALMLRRLLYLLWSRFQDDSLWKNSLQYTKFHLRIILPISILARYTYVLLLFFFFQNYKATSVCQIEWKWITKKNKREQLHKLSTTYWN